MTEEARNDLAPHGVLRAGINEGNQVLVSARSLDGGPDGVAPALAAELARRLGVPLQLVPYPSPGVLGDRAGANEWDIALLAADPARATAMDFTSPYAELPVTYLAHAGSRITSPAEADQPGQVIVATRGSAYALWLEAHLVQATLVRPGSAAEARELFATHEDYLLAGLASSLAGAAGQIPGTLVLPGHFMTARQAFACPPGHPAGLAFLQAFVTEAITSGLVAGLTDRFGVGQGLNVAPVPE
jgi:polar amino acid transport system substrate-binding protein